ncbi:sugar ABC transporter permease [Phaeobacter gallaeciensis]|uniref:Transport permease protein n=2 Tax=Roseobacteraceae TaxID=2854170 RepID=A0A366WVG7_9RHOB|nr:MULTISPECIES: ABC transporter permease [Roseobacteraceae]MBT3140046.1 ABC transporter permease [Falsiruegeria litorea]MBT8167234.1 ABC transporter permease [Falsiruegeria litorea]RBW52439.1 sugar ABC transporter permease [Phaeobacter gallaeciensis]
MAFPTAQAPKSRRFRTFRSVSALMLREMVSSYGTSPGGYAWAILEPVAGIALLSAVFSLILRAPSLGTNFPYFYATGLLPFLFYMTISNLLAASIRYSKPFLAYPAVTFMDALLARFFLNALTHFLVMVIVMTGIIVLYQLNPILDWSAIMLAVAMLVSLTLGVGLLNCYLSTRFTLWARLWAVANRPMFILAGIFFIPENVPERFREYFMLNPLAHITSQMRKGFFATYDAVYVSPLYVFMISIILAIFGLLLLIRYHKDIALL